ncbi:hypothetical protein OHT93_23040 [Streptomyces sp. NBC_00191]|uniref:hypothetical protein n=1 Tax=Streptomyces sp. NBC_00191 TaxID=2975674 RepID=UPI00324DA196
MADLPYGTPEDGSVPRVPSWELSQVLCGPWPGPGQGPDGVVRRAARLTARGTTLLRLP